MTNVGSEAFKESVTFIDYGALDPKHELSEAKDTFKDKLENDNIREGSQKKKLRKFGHMSELGLPYLPSSLVWTKKSLDKYSYCLPYLPIQKVWTFFN